MIALEVLMRTCIGLSLRNAGKHVHSRLLSSSHAPRQRHTISKLLANRNNIEDVQVNGWIRTIRKQKRVSFVALADGSTSTSLQAVLTPEQSTSLSNGTAVTLKGTWVQSTGQKQENELRVLDVEIRGENDAENNPIQQKYQSPEYLRTVPHLRARLPTNNLILRLRSVVIATVTRWFQDQGFVQCHTPIITSSDCEGAGEVFTISSKETQPFFRTPKYLTVSAQLHLEALSQAVDKVWTLSPTFRAEKSDTPRHLSEFYMLEVELCFVKSADEIMDVVENLLRHVAQTLNQSEVLKELISYKQKPEDADIEQRWTGLAALSWPRITYSEAIDILAKAHEKFSIEPSYNDGLAAEHERYLATYVGEGKPIFVTRYPAHQKPFYMARIDETADCFDLLVPELCELAGGSLREHRLQELQDAMKAKNVEGLDWYQDLRRYGSVSHGGFGIGFDRLICYLAGVPSIRDVVAFPRYYGRADC